MYRLWLLADSKGYTLHTHLNEARAWLKKAAPPRKDGGQYHITPEQ